MLHHKGMLKTPVQKKLGSSDACSECWGKGVLTHNFWQSGRTDQLRCKGEESIVGGELRKEGDTWKEER